MEHGWRRRRQERGARLLLAHAAFTAAKNDPVSRHYWEKTFNHELRRLLGSVAVLEAHLGPTLVWPYLAALSRRSYRPVIWLLAATPLHVGALMLTRITGLPKILPTLGPVYLIAATLAAYAYSGFVCRRLDRRLETVARLLHSGDTGSLTAVLGRRWAGRIRWRARSLPARAVLRSDLLRLLTGRTGVPEDELEVARILAPDFEGSARELLRASHRLVQG